MTLDILGTAYKVKKCKYDDDPCFARNSFDGYCDEFQKKIVVCDMTTYKGWEHEDPEAAAIAEKQTLRHEIVHAFLNESGLSYSSNASPGPWAKNEEMVDWFAQQGPKIYAAWVAAGVQ